MTDLPASLPAPTRPQRKSPRRARLPGDLEPPMIAIASGSQRGANMRSFVVLFGLMLTDAAFAAACDRPPTPDIPSDNPIGRRAERKLSRDVAQYVAASAKYVACLQRNGADPAVVAQEQYLALHAVTDLVDRYETQVGASDSLIAEMAKLAGANRPVSEVAFASLQRQLDSDAVPTLNTAIAHVDAGQYAEARAAIGELDFERLTPFERSKAETILYTVAYREENYEEAGEHARKALDAGGLSPGNAFRARLALADIDVMLRLRETAFVDRNSD